MKTWFYDCDYGQGSVQAETYEEARAKAIREAGTLSGVHNVHIATEDEKNFRIHMGGN